MARGKYSRMSKEASIYLKYLYQDKGVRGVALSKALKDKGFPPYSSRSVRRHAQAQLCQTFDKRHLNRGKLDASGHDRVEEALKSLREKKFNFTSVDVHNASGIDRLISNRTIRRSMRLRGYHYRQCRKKGLLTDKDLEARVAFATQYLKVPPSFWEKRISFYLDGTGWVHKVNPSSHAVTSRTRTWRKSSEGLHPHCTAKGKKEGVGGRVARFMVAISHGNGVIDAIPYEGSIDGKKFANIVKKNFPSLFQKSGSNSTIFLQDGDSSQNSAVARKAIEDKGYWIFHIPARSPDLNPIENVFHLAGKDIREQGRAIFKESYEEFVRRCRQTLLQFPADVIDRTISSIPKRLQAVVQSGGQRTKY